MSNDKDFKPDPLDQILDPFGQEIKNLDDQITKLKGSGPTPSFRPPGAPDIPSFSKNYKIAALNERRIETIQKGKEAGEKYIGGLSDEKQKDQRETLENWSKNPITSEERDKETLNREQNRFAEKIDKHKESQNKEELTAPEQKETTDKGMSCSFSFSQSLNYPNTPGEDEGSSGANSREKDSPDKEEGPDPSDER